MTSHCPRVEGRGKYPLPPRRGLTQPKPAQCVCVWGEQGRLAMGTARKNIVHDARPALGGDEAHNTAFWLVLDHGNIEGGLPDAARTLAQNRPSSIAEHGAPQIAPERSVTGVVNPPASPISTPSGASESHRAAEPVPGLLRAVGCGPACWVGFGICKHELSQCPATARDC